MSLFKNKYRVEPARLKNWDYSNDGFYFVTICTKKREHFFGEIENNKMMLNEIGKGVESEWLKTVELRPDMDIIIDEFVVMPNHFHAIIFIGTSKIIPNNFKNKFGPQRKNLASIIRGFKSSVTIISRKINSEFSWQPSFYDHIVRDENSLDNIRKYIQNNPKMWERDRNNDVGLKM